MATTGNSEFLPAADRHYRTHGGRAARDGLADAVLGNLEFGEAFHLALIFSLAARWWGFVASAPIEGPVARDSHAVAVTTVGKIVPQSLMLHTTVIPERY